MRISRRKVLGFTLTEILVAALIISAVAGFTVFAHSYIYRQMIYFEHRYAALFFARGELDNLLFDEGFASPSLDAGNYQIIMANDLGYQTHLLAGLGGVIDYTVTDTTATQKDIAYTISWQEINSPMLRQVSLQATLTDYRP